jgi:tetratricopeptide (TPR) repeat protein
MDEGDAVHLLRAAAKIRGAEDLVKMSNSKLARYCTKMKNNPGYIKWFVSTVQYGKRPEDILANPDLFLEFCMSNVYRYLPINSRKILTTLLCVPGQHSQAELVFLTNMEIADLQEGLQEAYRSNMITMNSVAKGSAFFESRYMLSDLAREYLLKHHPAPLTEQKNITKRRNRLNSAAEELRANTQENRYRSFYIAMRSKSDLIVAKYLKDAMTKASYSDYQESEKLLDKARSLAPEYFEVHRVEAFIKAKQGNVSAAKSAYENAVELEPASAPLRLWYGRFLMLSLDDTDGALKQFEVADQLDKNSIDVQIDLARANLYLREFDKARAILDTLLAQDNLQEKEWAFQTIYDLHIQFYSRKADFLVSQNSYIHALDHLKMLKYEYGKCPKVFIGKIRLKLGKVERTLLACINHLSEDKKSDAIEVFSWLKYEISATPKSLNEEKKPDSISVWNARDSNP